jgi:DNA replication protein DnaC
MISPATTNSSPRVPSPLNPQPQSPYESLTLHLKRLRLSHILTHWRALEQQATQEHWSYAQYLLALCELEAQNRQSLRIQRALTEAQLPSGKSLTNFIFDHCPSLHPATVTHLAEDTDWVEQGSNILIFGPSGTGKTHVASGLARSQVALGHRVKFSSATALVQLLQQAMQNRSNFGT